MDEHFAPSLLSLSLSLFVGVCVHSMRSMEKTAGEISLLSHVVNAQQSFSAHSLQTRRQS